MHFLESPRTQCFALGGVLLVAAFATIPGSVSAAKIGFAARQALEKPVSRALAHERPAGVRSQVSGTLDPFAFDPREETVAVQSGHQQQTQAANVSGGARALERDAVVPAIDAHAVVASEASDKPSATPAPNVVVRGIVASNRASSVALVARGERPLAVVVAGDALAGSRIAAIDRDSVRLADGRRLFVQATQDGSARAAFTAAARAESPPPRRPAARQSASPAKPEASATPTRLCQAVAATAIYGYHVYVPPGGCIPAGVNVPGVYPVPAETPG